MKPILDVQKLSVVYASSKGRVHQAVDNVSFTISKGQTVGLVGESGSGKSSIGRAVVGLVPLTGGSIFFKGEDVRCFKQRKEILRWRKGIQMIFQDPYNTLNPRMTVGKILEEPLKLHFPSLSKNERISLTVEYLEQVGLIADSIRKYPHQFSGGQRQRIGIARAISLQPELIICDEAVSALDVSVQAQIVNLLQDLQDNHKFSYLFIGHDLAVVQHISDYILVMKDGKLEEQGTAHGMYSNPQCPYTRSLLAAVPKLSILTSKK